MTLDLFWLIAKKLESSIAYSQINETIEGYLIPFIIILIIKTFKVSQ